jgi:hypothetical protein
MVVLRIDDNGDVCEREICKDIEITQWCIQNPDSAADVAVYPNPATNDLTVDLGENFPNGDVTIYVMDVNGKMITQKQTSSKKLLKLDISTFKTGMYFLNIEGDDNFKSRERFIKVSTK